MTKVYRSGDKYFIERQKMQKSSSAKQLLSSLNKQKNPEFFNVLTKKFDRKPMIVEADNHTHFVDPNPARPQKDNTLF
jgi:hypothetical protein